MIRPKKVEFIALNTEKKVNGLENVVAVNSFHEKEDYFWASVNLREKNNLILGVLR